MAQLYRLGGLVIDDRVAAPPVSAAGRVPEEAMTVARESFAELGLPGLLMAAPGTGDAGSSAWSLALGWADLERPEPLGVGHRFPAMAITQVITATAVLRLVADGLLELDAPANRLLFPGQLAGAGCGDRLPAR
jgi:CubicO group peptidase (beta-lactamase class C family)